MWGSGHALGDLVEAVADDLVDLLLAGGEVECGWEGVWWELSELTANLFSRDGAEVGIVEDLDDGGTEDGDGGWVEGLRLRHGCEGEGGGEDWRLGVF